MLLFTIPFVCALNDWQQLSTGTCQRSGQCLVKNSFNDVLDDIPTAYFDGLQNKTIVDYPEYKQAKERICDEADYCDQTCFPEERLFRPKSIMRLS